MIGFFSHFFIQQHLSTIYFILYSPINRSFLLSLSRNIRVEISPQLFWFLLNISCHPVEIWNRWIYRSGVKEIRVHRPLARRLCRFLEFSGQGSFVSSPAWFFKQYSECLAEQEIDLVKDVMDNKRLASVFETIFVLKLLETIRNYICVVY